MKATTDRIKALRKSLAISQEEFSKIIGISQRKASRIETNQSLDIVTARVICQLFEVEERWLLYGEGTEPDWTSISKYAVEKRIQSILGNKKNHSDFDSKISNIPQVEENLSVEKTFQNRTYNFCSIGEFSSIISVPESTVMDWINKGIILEKNYIRIGKIIRLDVEEAINDLKKYRSGNNSIIIPENYEKFVSALFEILKAMAMTLENAILIIDNFEEAHNVPEWYKISEVLSSELEVLHDEMIERNLPAEIVRDMNVLLRKTKDFDQRIDRLKLEEISSENISFKDFKDSALFLELEFINNLKKNFDDIKYQSRISSFCLDFEQNIKEVNSLYQRVINDL